MVLLVLGLSCSRDGVSAQPELGDGRLGDAVEAAEGGPIDLDAERGDGLDEGFEAVDLADAAVEIPGILDLGADVKGELDSVESESPDAAVIDTSDVGVQPDGISTFDSPAAWGPYEVGVRSFQFFDMKRQRLVPTTVWYPASPNGQQHAKYLLVIPGEAYQDAPPDKSGSPYPLVMFSHGFRGTAVQSVTFTEYVASHGYVVAAMDHQGNTLTDFFADDETVAKVALERPADVRFASEEVAKKSMDASSPLHGMVDPSRVAATGHSFGAYTALVVGGGAVDVTQAQQACAQGAPSDIFCDYVGYWPSGQVVTLEPGIPGLKAVVALAPGGYSAFGDPGLAVEKVPAMIFGGTLDNTCPVDVEIHPIYDALPAPKYEAVIEEASHMSFTNICSLPLAKQTLGEYCNVEGMLSPEKTFAATNTLVVAFLNLHLKKQALAEGFLTQEYLDQTYGYVLWQAVHDL